MSNRFSTGTCQYCHSTFTASRNDAKCCGPTCRQYAFNCRNYMESQNVGDNVYSIYTATHIALVDLAEHSQLIVCY